MKKRPEEIYSRLQKKYPGAKTALRYKNPWQLLVATMLSAQCTDARVNTITARMFKEHPDLNDYINMTQKHLVSHIQSAGFYKNKSKNILAAAEKIKKDFNGKVPDNMNDLIKLPGVARKTANVVLGNAFGKNEGIAVDTHVKRVSFRLGLTKETIPDKIEQDLMKIYPKNKWFGVTHLLIEHGRETCKAPAPRCSECILKDICPKKGVNKSA